MAEGKGDLGSMLAVMAPLADVEAAVKDFDLVLANKNAPSQSAAQAVRRTMEVWPSEFRDGLHADVFDTCTSNCSYGFPRRTTFSVARG